ncbi:MAG TPA: carotenoid biosynthesis protein [Pyrinomonadaceae bacterium]|jgi:putative membrane protein
MRDLKRTHARERGASRDAQAHAPHDEQMNTPRDEQTNITHAEQTRARRDEQARAAHDDKARLARPRAWRRFVTAALLFVYVVLWAGGAGRYLFVGTVDADETWLASLFLTVAGALVLSTAASRRDFLTLVAVAIAGLFIELCGARYGVPFGRYAYTGVLRPCVFGVPVVMAFAWTTLVAYVRQALSNLNLPWWAFALAAAAWMTLIDLVIDPLAANQLGYWRWTERGAYYGIPLTNFAGWFVSSLLIFALAGRARRTNAAHRFTGASIVLFFTLVALSFQLWTAALVGFALCASDALLRARQRLS